MTSTTTTTTNHTLEIDTDALTITFGGDLETMQYVPESEIDAACAAAGVKCTYVSLNETTYRLAALQTSTKITRRRRTVYGYTNFRFYCSTPAGRTTWFLTRAERDAGREAMTESARAEGLSDPDGAFTPVTLTARKGCGYDRQFRFDALVEAIKAERGSVTEDRDNRIGSAD